jgi:F0F1-type ATP synthase membrane subunit b/b'
MFRRSCARLCDWRYTCAPHIRVSYDKAQFTITRAVGLLFLTCTLVLPVLAREQAGNQASVDLTESPLSNESGRMLFWQWANFALLAGGLTYLTKKYAPPYFVKRSREIREGIIEAEEFRAEARVKVAAIDRRLANMDSEIEALRGDALRERETEAQHIRSETATILLRIQAEAAESVAAAGRAARLELRRYCSEIAVAGAEQKIAARISPQVLDRLVQTSVADLSKLAAAKAYAGNQSPNGRITAYWISRSDTTPAYPVPSGATSAADR